jgi:hypothetical protein
MFMPMVNDCQMELLFCIENLIHGKDSCFCIFDCRWHVISMLSTSQVNREPTRRMVSCFVLTLDLVHCCLLIQN